MWCSPALIISTGDGSRRREPSPGGFHKDSLLFYELLFTFIENVCHVWSLIVR